jgi:hypothetical protein
MAAGEVPPAGPAGTWSPAGGVAEDQLAVPRDWAPHGLPPEWAPPTTLSPPPPVDDTTSGGGLRGPAGWPLPSGALTRPPAPPHLSGDPAHAGSPHAVVQPDEALNRPGDEVSAGSSEPWPSLARASAAAAAPPDGLSGAGPVTVPRLDLAVAPPGPTGAPATAPASSDCRRPPAAAVRGEPAVSTTAAAAIAARFAADALSWDEDAPGTRAAALGAYGDDGDVGSKASWDGRGRQRVDLVLPPEEVLRLQSGDILVTLTARVVTYLRTAASWSDPAVAGAGGPASAVPRGAVAPAAAPSPDTPGWAAAQAYWVPISTVVRRTAAGYLAVELA